MIRCRKFKIKGEELIDKGTIRFKSKLRLKLWNIVNIGRYKAVISENH